MSRLNSESLPRPEEFAVGSAASRAAARALLKSRERGVRRITIVLDPAMCHRSECPDPNQAAVGPWYIVKNDGNLWRTAFIPQGMDDETKRRLIDNS